VTFASLLGILFSSLIGCLFSGLSAGATISFFLLGEVGLLEAEALFSALLAPTFPEASFFAFFSS
jgi:hypothetical protein